MSGYLQFTSCSSRHGLLQDPDLVLIPRNPGTGHWPLHILTDLYLHLMKGWGLGVDDFHYWLLHIFPSASCSRIVPG